MPDDPRKTDHDARVKALHEANARAAAVQALPPTPTQEENDLMALGLMHIDDKKAAPPPAEPRHTAPERGPEPHNTTARRT